VIYVNAVTIVNLQACYIPSSVCYNMIKAFTDHFGIHYHVLYSTSPLTLIAQNIDISIAIQYHFN